MMTQISKAQKVSVIWNNLEKEKLTLSAYMSPMELDNKYYCLSIPYTYSSKEYNLTMLDEKFQFIKTIGIPNKYDGNDIKPISITKGESSIILIFKYLETKGENRYSLLKVECNKDLSNQIRFDKIEDIQIKNFFNNKSDWDITYYNENRDVIIMKVPREALKKSDVYNITAYNNTLTKKEWTATMDLGEMAENYWITNSIFTNKAELVFIMQIRQKGFKTKTGNMLLCKFSKEKGFTYKEIVFKNEEVGFEWSTRIKFNKLEDKLYLYGTTKKNGSDNEFIYLKTFETNSLSEIDNALIDIGNSKENGLSEDGLFDVSYRFSDFTFKNLILNEVDQSFTFIGEIHKEYSESTKNNSDGSTTTMKSPGINSTILCLKISKEGELIKKFVIPRKMKLTDYVQEFSSFTSVINDNKIHFLFYDDPKNESFVSYGKDIKIKQVKHDNDLDLYMVTIDEKNQITKAKAIKNNTGNVENLKKKQNFEMNSITHLSNGKLLVQSGTSFGVLTVE